ncbi:aminotransferase class V-fold PLP-dependent enzyme [Streptomyces roseirectus]|uniref:Aminotransferase class V-fold PLP-dependent enzyme n=1 Tax=Streptomyces roseirectus TaxID=2768066 RepID=A0A7H0IQ77_9ACTN|nr:aminotransferase class V-fold PLP-dependent enzyme [Streptomyces roseirectus]QNP74943.1 aminotransferase class V-fold PLP-dependent enzyme [Streptomyces roseirectus]
MSYEHVSCDFRTCVEREFPALARKVYLDSACIGVAPVRALRAVTELVQGMQYLAAESGTAAHGRLNDLRAAARPLAARLIGARPSDIALVESATHGLKIAVESLPLEAGDEVLFPDLEFIQMGVAWRQLKERGVTARTVPHDASGAFSVDAVRDRLTPAVKVLALSSVQWTNGFRADLAALSELCRQRGVWLVVDAAQHLGALPFSVRDTPVDILVCGGHKWLCSPFGTGFLYLAPRARPRLRRPVAGFFAAIPPAPTWGEAFLRTDLTPLRDYEFTEDAYAWETGGTGNYPGAVGLSAALSLFLELRPQRIESHVLTLTEHLLQGLDRLKLTVVGPRGVRHRSAIVTFSTGNPRADESLMRWLLAAGVAVSVRFVSGVGGVRVSCHLYNTPRDVDALLEAAEDWRRGSGEHASPPPARPSGRRRTTSQIVRQRALIDALDDDLMGLVTAREGVSHGIRLSRQEGSLSRTDPAREREVIERFHHRLGPDGTRLALELLRMCKGQT